MGEAINLEIGDIDSANMKVHVRDGKFGKDRFVPLPRRTLAILRTFWKTHQHPKWLFPSKNHDPNQQMDRGGIQKALRAIVRDCGIFKKNQSSYVTSLLCHTPA
ncbi:tyrosine-type recombinase/integrase [Parashewanella hymeniacidonis]|uniref:tyrosine-type recombinase/integrase n=1 Tax=Parashewanella hymeniacidonis TaxID=2807618 RepID=UPI0023E8D69F|nr:tyrosine-type recombinase/integrase [Parashewanella hymeniacidonis]